MLSPRRANKEAFYLLFEQAWPKVQCINVKILTQPPELALAKKSSILSDCRSVHVRKTETKNEVIGTKMPVHCKITESVPRFIANYLQAASFHVDGETHNHKESMIFGQVVHESSCWYIRIHIGLLDKFEFRARKTNKRWEGLI